jgi:hypothetical protein
MSETPKKVEGWLDTFRESMRMFSNISDDLHGIAQAFYRTGNKVMYHELSGMANQITFLTEHLGDTHSAELDRQLQLAQESSAGILKACIAGTQIAGDRDSMEYKAHGETDIRDNESGPK